MVEITNTVPTDYIEVVRERLAAMRRRCEKKGMPAPTLVLGGTEMRLACRPHYDSPDHDGCPRAEWTTVTITGDTPRIGPWALVASVDDVGGVPVFRPVPGADVPVRFRNADPQDCDYCNVRRYRVETFIIHNNDDDEYRQVGRQCIKDFLGWDIGPIVRYWADISSMLGSDEEYGTYVKPTWKPADIIMAAANVVAVDGRYFKSDEYEDSTKGKVFILINPPANKYDRDIQEHYMSMADKAQAIYDATMREIQTLDTTFDWAYNVKTTSNADIIGVRQVGILASSVILGLRAIEKAATADSTANTFVGRVGDKLDIEVTIKDTNTFNGNYGLTTLVTFGTDDGAIIKWFASGSGFPSVGTRVRLSGTVKKHDEYKGTRQTMVTRCKVTPVTVS